MWRERSIVQEMLKDINKYFNNDDDCHTSQKLIGRRDVFRGIVLKEWVMGNNNNMNLHACNKVLVKIRVKFYHEY